MILNILDQTFVQKQKQFLISRLKAEADRIQAGRPASIQAAEEYEVVPEDLGNAARFLSQSEAPENGNRDLAYLPGDVALSLLQTCLDSAYMASGAVVEAQVSGLAAGPPVFVPISNLRLPDEMVTTAEIDALVSFEEGDPRYATQFLFAKAYRRLTSKPKFVDSPARINIADKARIVLFGDWGSGIDRAQLLSRAIQSILSAAPDREGHAIHLGDVYFAGFEHEYTQRVIPYWPGLPGKSWSISGNHDMYTGGMPFFHTLLTAPPFVRQNHSSWFVFDNPHWQLFGLDSAFQPPDARGLKGDLAGTQAEQLIQIRNGNLNKGGIFFSHHQPFNVDAGQFQIHSPKMIEKLKPALDQGHVRAWFWGHEHDCAVYKPWNNVDYPCLTGNAGVPALHKGAPADPLIRWRWNDSIQTPDGNYATLGFTVLDLTGDTMEVSFYNESGVRQNLPDGPHIVKSR